MKKKVLFTTLALALFTAAVPSLVTNASSVPVHLSLGINIQIPVQQECAIYALRTISSLDTTCIECMILNEMSLEERCAEAKEYL